jgi:hypothetical protein
MDLGLIREVRNTWQFYRDRRPEMCLRNYGGRCAVCDVDTPSLLVASHIVPWSESVAHRGHLDNVICMCVFHDALFERGYWTLDSELRALTLARQPSETIRRLLELAPSFESVHVRPSAIHLAQHRLRHRPTTSA